MSDINCFRNSKEGLTLKDLKEAPTKQLVVNSFFANGSLHMCSISKISLLFQTEKEPLASMPFNLQYSWEKKPEEINISNW